MAARAQFRRWLEAIAARAWQPRDAAALAAFRVCYGALVAISAARFLWNGWVDELFVRPRFFFTFYGFSWVRPLPQPGMTVAFIVLALTGVAVSLGIRYRWTLGALLVVFGYIQLIDVTNYLNHYYLVWLLGLLLWFMPLGRAYGFDGWRAPERRLTELPAWCTYVLRFQVATVYFYAGLAKLNADWLLHAEPLSIWLNARTDMPLLGALLHYRVTAFLFAWAGFLFDSTIWAFLAWSRTRRFAYVVVLGFHAMTSALFPIGMFPVIMSTAALVFFGPSWPRELLRRVSRMRALRSVRAEHAGQADLVEQAPPSEVSAAPASRWGLVAFGLFALFQWTWPMRHLVYGHGSVMWHEQGMRFGWRVMAREKTGDVTYLVDYGQGIGEKEVSPTRYLTDRQLRDFATQPDMILRLAHHIRDEARAQGYGNVRVRAEAYVSWNGRPAELLLDPQVNLAAEHDGFREASWIRPAPTSAPARIGLALAGGAR
jgi:hypothetical protein